MEAGPYGITQFDAAGVVGNYQAMQHNRIAMMVAQKQLEKINKETADESAASKAVSAYYNSQGASGALSTANPASAAPTAAGGVPAAYGAPADPLAPLPAQPASAPGPGPQMPNAAARQKLIGTLLAIDAPTAEKYMSVFASMDKSQAEQVAQRNTQIMQVMGGLLSLPAEQRKAAIQQQAPQLQQLGYTPDQLSGFDPSDANLRSQMAQHMDADKLIAFVKPEINAVAQGGSLVRTDATGQSHTVYETPTVTVGQNVYPRPGAMSATAPPAAIDHLRSHPELAPAFDQKYGNGAAARALGGQSSAPAPTGTFRQ